MKRIQAVYENGVFRPTDPVDLPENSQVRLTVESESGSQTTLARLAEIAEEYPENPDLPEDLAAQHDHYLYGVPKK